MLYLLGALGSLVKRDSAKFEKKSLNVFAIVFFYQILMRCYFQLHWNLKLVFSVACREISRFPIVLLLFQYFLRVYHQKPLVFLLQLILMYCTLLFLYSSLSVWSLDFLNFLKILSLVFIFFKPFLSNYFWVTATGLEPRTT